MQTFDSDSFQQRLDAIQSRIHVAAERANRDPAEVQLVTVTKTFPPEAVQVAIQCGCSVLGENRVQEALAKAPLCSSADWHLIGRLQRNKIRHALSLFSTLHSVDSIPLLEDLARIQEETGNRPQILLEVNVAAQPTKIGFTPTAVREAFHVIQDLGCLQVVGLMTVPPWTPDPEASRCHFTALRNLRDSLEQEFSIGLPELSMGMSCDFEVAIECGASFVRVGTALMGKRTAYKPQPKSLDTDDFI